MNTNAMYLLDLLIGNCYHVHNINLKIIYQCCVCAALK